MIFAETDRLHLRSLGKEELPRLTELIGVWDVARWLTVVPFPYRLRDAEDFFATVEASYAKDEPEFFAMSLKDNKQLIGGIGLHEPRTPDPVEGEVEIGYWLAKDYWGQGLMSEAACTIVDMGFARPTTCAIGATTAPTNNASNHVLQKAGLRNMGAMPRPYTALRGSDEVLRWLITREEWEKRKSA